MSTPDYSAFKTTIKTAIARHFETLIKLIGDDRCIGYSLYTADGVPSIGPVANRASALKAKLADPLYTYYRFSADEWSEWDDFGIFAELNDSIRRYAEHEEYSDVIAPKLLTACVDALVELKAAGLFAVSGDELFLVVWVSDSASVAMQHSAEKLNSAEAYRAFTTEFIPSE